MDVCRACKEKLDYTFLVDLTAVDWKERPEGRFDVVYWLHRFTGFQAVCGSRCGSPTASRCLP